MKNVIAMLMIGHDLFKRPPRTTSQLSKGRPMTSLLLSIDTDSWLRYRGGEQEVSAGRASAASPSSRYSFNTILQLDRARNLNVTGPYTRKHLKQSKW